MLFPTGDVSYQRVPEAKGLITGLQVSRKFARPSISHGVSWLPQFQTVSFLAMELGVVERKPEFHLSLSFPLPFALRLSHTSFH